MPLVLLAAFLIAVTAGASTPLTIEDYAGMPALSSARFSPDGTRIAYVVTRADFEQSVYDSDIWLIGADGRNGFQLTRGRRSDHAPRWAPDGTSVAFLSDRDGATAVYLIGAAGGEAEKVTGEEASIRMFEWSPDGRAIAFVRLDARSAEEERRAGERDDARVAGEDSRHAHLHVIDLETRRARRLTSGSFSIFGFSWSPDSKSIAFDRGPANGLDGMYHTDIYLVDAEGGEPRPVVVREGLDRNPRFSPDGRFIAFTSTRGEHDWLREHFLHLVSLADGSITTIGAAYGRTPEQVIWSPDGRTLWFEGPMNSTTQLFRIGADGSRLTSVTGAAGMVTDADVHVPTGRIAFVHQTLAAPPELYVSSNSRFEPRRLTNHNAAYRDRLLGETRLVRWKNPKDGLEIEGLLTLPVGYVTGRRYPLLTFVHGGPASRFDQAFLGYLGYIYPTHVFAARGFAVLRPNPRGTGGYGEAFRQANRNDWGGMDWLDIETGIDMVIGQGIADPRRLGVMGWSYGGFMASWAISRTDRFRAISIGAPVVDLLSFHGTTDIRHFIPNYFRNASLDEMRARSPLWHLRKIRAPVLIQHGEADDRVPLSQGTMLYRLLEELGVEVTMVIYPRTPHTPREPKLRLDVARRNIEFFEKHVLPAERE
ncbi:MAG TPA: S9 family peptidase [Thermoanaerobaculia bacterium]|nr:S9 family peptidase [Thermoanaerobaculia bacterium]